ncbi:hypothetical protein KDM41_03995, partial [bacterium]|nr:hypothetical protein [bacterium]
MALCMCLVLISGVATAQDIDDIQVYDAGGAPASPYLGQSVTVTGQITVLKGTYNSGTWYIQDATGGIQFFDSAAGPFALGDVVEVTGTVSTFSGELQIGTPSSVFLSAGTPVVPASYDISALTFEEVGSLIE